MKVFVSGAAGSLGRVVTLVLRDVGHEVVAVDQRDETSTDLMISKADLRDDDAV